VVQRALPFSTSRILVAPRQECVYLTGLQTAVRPPSTGISAPVM